MPELKNFGFLGPLALLGGACLIGGAYTVGFLMLIPASMFGLLDRGIYLDLVFQISIAVVVAVVAYKVIQYGLLFLVVFIVFLYSKFWLGGRYRLTVHSGRIIKYWQLTSRRVLRRRQAALDLISATFALIVFLVVHLGTRDPIIYLYGMTWFLIFLGTLVLTSIIHNLGDIKKLLLRRFTYQFSIQLVALALVFSFGLGCLRHMSRLNHFVDIDADTLDGLGAVVLNLSSGIIAYAVESESYRFIPYGAINSIQSLQR